MKVAIIGTGNVGSNLGGQLLKTGKFEVKYGSRDPQSEKVKKLLQEQSGATAEGIQAASSWADAIILAVPTFHTNDDIHDAAAMLGPGAQGKVIIDTTNTLALPGLESVHWGSGTSGGEVLAAALPTSYVFKAFNTLGLELMVVPDGSTMTGEQLTLLFAGPKEKEGVAADIIAGVGFKPAYVGPIRYARNLEAIAELWIHLAVPSAGETREDWGRNFHFQVMGGK